MIPCLVVSRIFGLPVRVFLLIACLHPVAMSSTKWELDNDFENNLDTSELLWEKDGISMLTCGSHCNQKPSCLSFFYNPSLKKCLGSKSFKRGLPAGHVTQQEWKYYTRPQLCDGGYEYNETLKLCYKIYNGSTHINSSDAMDACETEGAKLIVIENAIQFEHIKNSIGNLAGWIGLQSIGAEREWKWWNGKTASFIAWYPNQPDILNETCVTIHDGGYWDDDCSILRVFVCQKNVS